MISYTFFGGAPFQVTQYIPSAVQQPHALRRDLRTGSVDG